MQRTEQPETFQNASGYIPEPQVFKTFFTEWCNKNRSPLHKLFVEDVLQAPAEQAESTRRLFVDSVFRRGTDILLHNMPAPALPGRGEGQTLYEVIQPERLRAELESVRATGNIAAVSAKEREIADAIQGEVGRLGRINHVYLPADILSGRGMCCVGASLIGGELMGKAGLNYLVGDVPGHSLLYIITGNREIEWRDMFKASNNEIITDDWIRGVNKDGSTMTTGDIVSFSKNPNTQGLKFEIPCKKYNEKLPWIKEGEKHTITLLAPGYGQEIQVLGNLALLLSIKAKCTKDPEERNGFLSMAALAYQQAVKGEPQLPLLYCGLGRALNEMGNYAEGAAQLKKAIQIDPDYVQAYHGLVESCCELGHTEDAREAFRELQILASRFNTPFNNFSCREAGKLIAVLNAERRTIN